MRSRVSRDVLLAAAAVAFAALLLTVLAGRESQPGIVAFAGRFHPLAVHLPIGVLLLAAVLEGLAVSESLRVRTDPVFAIVLRMALVSAVAAFALGLLLAGEGKYAERLLRMHRRLAFATVVASAVSVVVWSMHVERRLPRLVHRCAVGMTVTMLGIGAHFGGSMTHGEDYLAEYAPWTVKRTAEMIPVRVEPPPPPAMPEASPAMPEAPPLPPEAPPPPKPAARPVKPAPAPAPAPAATDAGPPARLFSDLARPILANRCNRCHSGKRPASGVVMTDRDALVAKGYVMPGDPSASPIMQRMMLPLDDDEHMPPSDAAQPSRAEIEAIASWIRAGAQGRDKE